MLNHQMTQMILTILTTAVTMQTLAEMRVNGNKGMKGLIIKGIGGFYYVKTAIGSFFRQKGGDF